MVTKLVDCAITHVGTSHNEIRQIIERNQHVSILI
jgi:hypothetical protein